ncbi:hypothetical protein EMCRGX_G013056 [Ephydatia muelleri]
MEEKERYFCSSCKVSFAFKSRYERHLNTASHQAYAQCIAFDENRGASVLTTSHLAPSHDDSTLDVAAKESFHVDVEQVDVGELQGGATSPRGTSSPSTPVIPIGTEEREAEPGDSSQLMHSAASYAPFASKMLAMAYLMHTTSSGIPFYVNPISDSLKMCLGTPEIARNLVRYPVIPKGEFKEVFHALRWRNDKRFFAPMSTTPCGNVFIGDFVEFTLLGSTTPSIGHVRQFLCQEGQDGVFANVFALEHVPFMEGYVLREPSILVPVQCIQAVVADMQTRAQSVFKYQDNDTLVELTGDEYTSLFVHHPLKEKSVQSGGMPVIMVPLTVFTDDTSGNKSKVWNKFDSWNYLLEGLPKKENGKLHNIHFICASNKARVLEMAVPLVQELNLLEHEGIIAYDASLQCKVIVVAPVLSFICDNPRGAELCSHLGATTSKYCRICLADVSTGLQGIGELRKKCDTMMQIRSIRSARCQADKKQLKKRFGISAEPNPVLELAVDPHESTPVEVLHTLLLGPYKYLVRNVMGRLTSAQKLEVLARISSFPFSGFAIRLTRNIAKYYKSFVGRDFKALAQLALFVFFPYLTAGEIEVWFALSKVFRMVYCQPFKPENIALYNAICLDFMRAVDLHAPELKGKLKIHLILHLPENMLMFGPASTFNTERCESFNGTIRAHNIYANRHAPSKDIATSFAIQQSMRFVCSGGHFDPSERCGDDLVQLYQSSEVENFLGGGSTSSYNRAIDLHGGLRKINKKAAALGSVMVKVQEFDGIIAINSLISDHSFTLFLHPNTTLLTPVLWGRASVGSNGQMVNVGDFVHYTESREPLIQVGVFLGCFENEGKCFCIVRYMEPVMNGTALRLNQFDCPLFTLTNILRVLPSVNISCSISVVHQCSTTCVLKEKAVETTLERHKVTQNTLFLSHDWSNNLYCYNVFCMSNNM